MAPVERPLEIDCVKERARIALFIREKAAELRRGGAVLGLSGGLDSTLTAALCVEALGRGNVTGLILPDSEGNPRSREDALLAAEWLGIGTETKDISRALRAIGAGSFFLSGVPARKIREKAVGALYRRLHGKLGEDPFLHLLGGPTHPLIARGNAHFKAKHRMRMVAVCHFAESRNLLVVGAANKTEKLTGLFCRFGVDHCADVMPIGSLFRTQVERLAGHVGVPREILEKPSSPDMVGGLEDKYRFLAGLPAAELDLVLHFLERGTPPERVSDRTGIPFEKVVHVREMNRRSLHMRLGAAEPGR